uniref:gliding motility-associated C-terminal domain-containing protein n=1 Tax=Flavobacterium sp. TaxID=239 RepID=UPI00286E2E74
GQTDCSIVCEVDLGPNQELCGVTSVPLDSQLANPLATFTWKKDGVLIPGALSQTYTATSSGTYTCIGKCGPNDVTDSVVINLGPNVIVPEQANYTLCDDASNDGIASFDLTTLTPNVLIGLDTNFTYNVTYHYTEANALANTNAINPNVLYIGASQTIYIRITTVGATSCNTVVAQNLVVNSLPIATISSTDSDNTICSDEISASKIIVTPSNFAIANATYVWSLDGIVIPGAITNEIVPTLTGTYSVVVTLASGCSNTTALDLLFTINTKPDFALTGTNLVKCADEVAVLSVIPTNFTVTDPNISYIWKLDGNVLTGMNTSSISETDYGVYSVEITNFQCKTIQQITVTLDTTEIPINTNGECVGINYILTASPVSSSYDPETVTYLWTNQSGVPVGSNQETFNVSEYVIENGISFDTFPLTFNVKVTTNPDGCTDNQSFEVITSFCTVQKGLSPNGDGSNDYFDLRGLDVKELSVFNRYGTKIYSKTNYKNEWRGQNSKSENSPVGTYYYVIEQKNGETKTGWIYLNR